MAASAQLGSEVTGHAPAGPVDGAPATPVRREPHRALVVGAPVVYVVALAVFVLSWGLPLAHDQLFLWLLLGLAAFSVPAWRSWGAMLLAWLPWLGLLVVYDELRGAVSVCPGDAHVAPQIAHRPVARGRRGPDRMAAGRGCGAPATCTGTTSPSGPCT